MCREDINDLFETDLMVELQTSYPAGKATEEGPRQIEEALGEIQPSCRPNSWTMAQTFIANQNLL
jgi:hypothetical protein